MEKSMEEPQEKILEESMKKSLKKNPWRNFSRYPEGVTRAIPKCVLGEITAGNIVEIF